MLHLQNAGAEPARTTELTLSDRLIALAQEAERGGFRSVAAQLVLLACAVFDEPAVRH